VEFTARLVATHGIQAQVEMFGARCKCRSRRAFVKPEASDEGPDKASPLGPFNWRWSVRHSRTAGETDMGLTL